MTNAVIIIADYQKLVIALQLAKSCTDKSVHFLGRKKSKSLLVRFRSMHYCTSTLRLSTRWSFWGIMGKSNLEVSFALNMLSALICSAL